MAEFNFDWNDFRFGYSVVQTDINEPKSSWKGYNVSVSDDDGTLVPMYAPVQLSVSGSGASGGVIDHGSTVTTWSSPTYLHGWVVFTAITAANSYVYFINTSTGAITRRDLGAVGTSVGSAPVCVPYINNPNISAYVVIGTSTIYKVNTDDATVTTVTSSYGSLNLHGLTLWNARLIAWSNEYDTVLFSNALDFDTTWPALNYFAAGYSNDGVSKCIPRNLDLVIVKPSGWFSVTGVLGVSAAVRQMNDTLGILPIDPAEQHNNAIYYTTQVGYTDYAVNLFQIVGGRIDIAAFQRFGIGDSNIRIARTNIGFLGVTALIDEPNGVPYCNMYLMNVQDRWDVMRIPRFTSETGTAAKPIFCLARGQVSRFNSEQDRYIYLLETTSAANSNKAAVIKIKPNTVEPGQNSDYTPSTGVVKLSNIANKKAFLIKEVYAEVEMMQIPTIGSMHAYTGSASISCTVNNKSVSDITFDDQTPSPEVSSSSYTFPFADFTSNTSAVTSQFRVLRFRVDNATWGYFAEIGFTFAGLRIRRVWLNGESR